MSPRILSTALDAMTYVQLELGRNSLENGGMDKNSQHIAQLIQSEQKYLIEKWIDCLKKNIESAENKNRVAIRDHIPLFFQNIIEALKHDNWKQEKKNIEYGKEHGKQRKNLGDYTLKELIREYHILRTVIFDYLDEKTEVHKEARNLINEYVDDAISEAAVIFEEGLASKESLVRTQNAFLESAGDLLWMYDRDFRLIYANKRFLELWGRSEEEAMGKTALELGYEPHVASKIESDAKKALNGNTIRSETHYTGPRGEPGHYQYTLSPYFDEEGKVTAVAGISRDITEQKRLEREVVTARNELYQFFMQAPAPLVILTGDDFVFTLANPPYEKLIGRKAHGRKVLEVFSEEELKDFMPLLKSVYYEGKTYSGHEAPLTTKNEEGSSITRYLTYGYRPLRESDGSIKGVLAVVQDLTDQVLSRIEVENKINELVNILDTINDGFFSLDADFNITQVNRQHVSITHLNAEDQIGRNLFELFPGAKRPESEYWKAYRKAMKERVAVTFEDYYADLNVWTRVNVVPKDDGGIAAFYKDITEEKIARNLAEAEREKFEAIFFDSPALMALLRTKDFIFEKANPRYLKLFEGRNILNLPFVEAIPEIKEGPLPEIMKKVFETDETFYGTEMKVPLIHKDQGLVDHFFDFTYSRVNDGEGNPYGIYIHAMDVTEKVLARRKLRDAVKARDEFLSIASHELKTPISSIKLQIQAVRRKITKGQADLTPEKMLHLFDKNLDQINRLVRLVDDMLDLSRVQSGKLSYNFVPLDLCQIVTDVFDRFKETFEEKNISFNMKCVSSAKGRFDRERIEQVLINLITNALKYGQGSPVEVTLSKNSGKALLKVQDKGMGIDVEYFQKIFQRFERVISASEVSGLGIGLYISRQMVEAHGGRIWVESQKGEGSSFYVELPIEE